MDITSELTIVIPVRIDSKERIDNINSIVNFLLRKTLSKIIILETGYEQKLFIEVSEKRFTYYFEKDEDIIFHHTKYRNQLLRLSTTDIVAVWDADIFLNLFQIKKSAVLIRDKQITMCLPYDGRAFYLNAEDSVKARININLFIQNYKDGKLLPYLGRPSIGGIFIVNKNLYLKAGGENENFYGWGAEDTERLKRMEILQESIERIPGPVFHLYHPRGINSTFGHDERDKRNVRELVNICRMDTDQLKEYINTWVWKQ